jgi:hypothetical protein
MTKRKIALMGIGKELELSKATAVKVDKQMIHLDQLPDGTWRLIYSANLIPDIKLLQSLTIIREDDESPMQDSNPR